MAVKKTINESLIKMTGYQISKHRPAAPVRPKKTAKAPAKKAPKPAPKPAAPKFPADYDDVGAETIRTVKPRTMTSPEKLYALILAIRYVTEHKIPGDIVECGVWRGGSMQAIARTLLELEDTSRELYLFDTFEGMPPPTEKDVRHDGRSAAHLLENSNKDSGVWAVAGLDDVKAGMSEVPYPSEKIHYVQGLVEETILPNAPEQISILRLDTDWYESTKFELDALYPRLSPGGVLLIDDYGWWQGSRTAVEEFLAETGARLLFLRMDEGRIAVKP